MRILLPLLALTAAAGCREAPPTEPQAEKIEAPATADSPAQIVDRMDAGKAAPTAAFVGPDGTKVSIADFKGKPVLVNLWATWCAPCVTEMPQLDQLAATQEDLRVITVSQDMGEEAKAKIDEFFAEKKFARIKAYRDPEGALSTAFNVVSLPTTVLFDKDGKEVWRLIGPEEWTGKKAAALIAEAS